MVLTLAWLSRLHVQMRLLLLLLVGAVSGRQLAIESGEYEHYGSETASSFVAEYRGHFTCDTMAHELNLAGIGPPAGCGWNVDGRWVVRFCSSRLLRAHATFEPWVPLKCFSPGFHFTLRDATPSFVPAPERKTCAMPALREIPHTPGSFMLREGRYFNDTEWATFAFPRAIVATCATVAEALNRANVSFLKQYCSGIPGTWDIRSCSLDLRLVHTAYVPTHHLCLVSDVYFYVEPVS